MAANDKIWFIHTDNAPDGPYSTEEIWEKINNNSLDYNSFIWKKDFKTWKRIEEEPTFDQTPPDVPPPIETPPTLIVNKKADIEPRIWYLNENRARSGPFRQSEVIEKIRKGVVTTSTFIWKKGMKEWTLACKTTEFKEYFKKEQVVKKGRRAKDFISGKNPPTPPSVEEKHVTTELRKHPRAPLLARIIAHDNQDIAYMPCGNISAGGTFVFAEKNIWSPGTQLKLNIKSEELPEAFNVEGEVIRFTNKPQRGYNIKFSKLPKKFKLMIKDYVDNKNR